MKILAVCGVGMGSSLILRMNIEAVLRENGVDASVEHSDVTGAKGADVDYIATSKDLADTFDGDDERIMVINNFIDKNEIKEVLVQAGIIK
jgi:PTS system ascorbate-specific IIB component